MKNLRLILTSIIVALSASLAQADYSSQGRIQLLRDETFEQNLRWERSADKAVTPAKVLRWVRGLRGQVTSAPSKAEFQPIVDANEYRVRVVCAIAYKF